MYNQRRAEVLDELEKVQQEMDTITAKLERLNGSKFGTVDLIEFVALGLGALGLYKAATHDKDSPVRKSALFTLAWAGKSTLSQRQRRKKKENNEIEDLKKSLLASSVKKELLENELRDLDRY